MNSRNISKKYVSRKINVIRFKPNLSNTKEETFVSGTWGDGENALSLWYLMPDENQEPQLLEELPFSSSVHDIQYVGSELFAVAGGQGQVSLCAHNRDGSMQVKHNWNQLHSFSNGLAATVTALAVHGDQLVSVGEDGVISVNSVSHTNAGRSFEGARGCSLYSVVFSRAQEILTGDMQGDLRLWDLRTVGPAKALVAAEQVGVFQLACHPTQPQLVAAGGEDGSLTIWDLRETRQPFSVISAHTGPVTGVQFHPSSPSHLFTCAMDGQLLHWNSSSAGAFASSKASNDGSLICPWLSSDVSRGAVETSCLLSPSTFPLNSIDIKSTTLLAASDSEAIFTVRHTLLY